MIDDVQALGAVLRSRPPHYRDYINLTRGALCPHLDDLDPIYLAMVRYVRIPSTWCEQKRWGDILTSLGADFYMDLARGVDVTVHDVSEKDRETRAMWQGLEWVEYACTRTWYRGDEDRVQWVSRSGMNVRRYWDAAYKSLGDTHLALLRYYGNFIRGRGVNLSSCYGEPTRSVTPA